MSGGSRRELAPDRRNACYDLRTSEAARVLADALSLSEEERVRIAEELLLSVRPDGVPSDEDAATLAELRARAAQVKDGDRSGTTWPELRKNLGSE